jgi:hypothetical protein
MSDALSWSVSLASTIVDPDGRFIYISAVLVKSSHPLQPMGDYRVKRSSDQQLVFLLEKL